MVTAKRFSENFEKAVSRKVKISSEVIEKVRGMAIGKNSADLQDLLKNSTLINQYVAASSLIALAVETSQTPHTFDLAIDIVAGQGEKIARYGNKAYSLSERQIRVVADQVSAWIK